MGLSFIAVDALAATVSQAGTGSCKVKAGAAAASYEYVQLAAAAAQPKKRVNVYGVIVDYDQPRRTQGSDVMRTVHLMDPSCDKLESIKQRGFTVNVFAPSEELLPPIRAVGDILRLHRFDVKVDADGPLGSASTGGPPRQCAFALFDGDAEGNGAEAVEAYAWSGESYTLAPSHNGYLSVLRTWRQQNRGSHLNRIVLGTASYQRQLKEVCGFADKEYVDIVCKVLYVRAWGLQQATLHVWDGTDLQPVEGASLAPSVPAECFGVPSATLSAFPGLGSVVPVVAAGSHVRLELLPKAGQWVHMRNVHAWVAREGGRLCALFDFKTRWIPLTEHTAAVAEREEAYAGRLDRVNTWVDDTDLASVTSHDSVAFSSIRQVLTHPQVTGKFRCLVRVVGHAPADTRHFCTASPPQVYGVTTRHAATDDERTRAPPVFAVSLMLQDPTGTLEALLLDKDAEKFFGIRAQDAAQLHGSVAVRAKMQALLAGGVGHADGRSQWIACCLVAYRMLIDGDAEQSRDNTARRRFRMFATRLKL
eukprot:jgi/Chlat1/8490/Chrsp80S07931